MGWMRATFPTGARIAFAMAMLFVLSLSGMMSALTKASASAMHGSGLALFCDPSGPSDKQGGTVTHHCDACLVQSQRDPAPDLSGMEGVPVILPEPLLFQPLEVLVDDMPIPSPLIARRSTPPRASPALI